MLPEVKDCAADFGVTERGIFGAAIPIAGRRRRPAGGDRRPGLLHAGHDEVDLRHRLLRAAQHRRPSRSPRSNRLLTTIAYQLDGKRTYALEGSIFVAGAAVQWLRDGLGIIAAAGETAALADAADPGQSVYLVPAFVGLGAPYWDADARGALFGLTRDTGRRDSRAPRSKAVCYQTRDLLDAMRRDWGERAGASPVLRVDGGMTASDWTMQFLADILDAPVDRPAVLETTALGAAYLAGLQAGALPAARRLPGTMAGASRAWPRTWPYYPCRFASPPWTGAHRAAPWPFPIACRCRTAFDFRFDCDPAVACCRLPFRRLAGCQESDRNSLDCRAGVVFVQENGDGPGTTEKGEGSE